MLDNEFRACGREARACEIAGGGNVLARLFVWRVACGLCGLFAFFCFFVLFLGGG